MKIEGYFDNSKAANKTVEKLKNLGFKEAFIDMNDHYSENRNVQTNLPGTETSGSLSGLVLESDAHGVVRDKGPLTAANPMVSGMGTFEEIADVNCRVVVESEEGNANKIKQIIREMGGNLENPNIKKPRIENSEEMALNSALRETRNFLEREDKMV